MRETADAMPMPVRTYSNLEAARSSASFEDILRFTDVTQSDLFGVVAAIALQTPGLAIHTADNKLGLIMQFLLKDLIDRAGAGTAALAPDDVFAALSDGFERLAQSAQALRPDVGPKAETEGPRRPDRRETDERS